MDSGSGPSLLHEPPQSLPLFLYFYVSLARECPIGVETIELGKFETTRLAKDATILAINLLREEERRVVLDRQALSLFLV